MKTATLAENWFMALTMLPFLVPAALAANQREWCTFVCIVYSGIASAVYHAAESQKHQLTGVHEYLASAEMNMVLINADRIGAVLLACRMFGIYGIMPILLSHYLLIGVALTAMALSETVYRHDKWRYIVLHSVWHFAAAALLISLLSM
jgi:hypothetical protein